MGDPQRVFLVVARSHNYTRYGSDFAGVTLLVVATSFINTGFSARLRGTPTSMDPFYYVRNWEHSFDGLHWEIKELQEI